MYLGARRDLLSDLNRVLHVAPEPPVAQVLRRWATDSYISMDIDLSIENITVRADLTRLPFRSKIFDCVYCSHALEHVPEDQRAMEELHRVLRPGGWALIQVPIKRDVTFEDPTIVNPDVRRRLFGQPDHVRVYGRDFTDRLARARFSVSIERPQRALDRDVVARCGLNAKEDIFLCTKAG